MAYHADEVYGACDCCLRARQNRNGYWYCTSHQDDYFPDAEVDEEEDGWMTSTCHSFKADPCNF